jgi:hypothetical protein
MIKAIIYKPNGMERTCKDTKTLLIRILLFIGALLFFATSIKSQEVHDVRIGQDSLFSHISREMSAKFSCYLRYTPGSGAISSELTSNTAELEKLDTFIRQAQAHPTLFISRILLTGYSSIEGAYARNESLARQRVEQFYLYLREHYPELYRYPHNLAWVAEDWGGLSTQIKASKLNEREEILDIIRKITVYDEREALLTKLNGGHAWLFMQRELFPGLRRVELQVEYTTHEPTIRDYSSTASPYNPPTASVRNTPTASPRPAPKEKELGRAASDTIKASGIIPAVSPPPFFAEDRGEGIGSSQAFRFVLKTNLLLWAGVRSDFRYTTPVANAALEYYIDDRWSVELGAMYSYWQYNSNRKFQGISGYRLEPRYRFTLPYDRFLIPCDRFEIYVGLYGRTGDYDLRSVDSSQLTVDSDNDAQPTLNYTGKYWDAGLSTGLTFHLVGGLGLEVGARAGYVRSRVVYYTPEEGTNWYERERKYNKLRVTDLNLSLIYRFK